MCLSSGQRYEPIRLLLMVVFVLWSEFVCGFTLCFVERVHLAIGGTLTASLPGRGDVYLFASMRRLHPRFLGWGSGELPAHPL